MDEITKSISLNTKALVICSEFKARSPIIKLRGFLAALASNEIERKSIVENAKRILLDDMTMAAYCKDPFFSIDEINALIADLDATTGLMPRAPSDSQVTQKIDRSRLKFLDPPEPKTTIRKASFSEQMAYKSGPRVCAATTILIADDDQRIRTMFKVQISQKLGYSVIEAKNGTDAWEIISRHAMLGLIILDMKMPGKHGPEILQDMRTNRIDIPVFVCSAYDFQDMLYPDGNVRYFTKPVSMEEMLAEIKGVLSPVAK